MKTKEEIKREVVNYLTKTLNHTFRDEKKTYLFKVVKIENDFYAMNIDIDNDSYRMYKIDTEYYIKYYVGNAKNVIKNTLFLNKKLNAIKNTKYIKELLKKHLETKTAA